MGLNPVGRAAQRLNKQGQKIRLRGGVKGKGSMETSSLDLPHGREEKYPSERKKTKPTSLADRKTIGKNQG